MAHSLKRSLGFSGALIALWLGLKLVLPLILPFVLGAGLALAAEPAAKFLGRRCRLPGLLASGLAVSALVAGLGLLALLLAALAVSQLSSLTRVLPALLQKVQSGVFLLQNRLLELATCGKTRFAYIRNGSDADKQSAEEAGFHCLEPDLDRSGFELRSTGQASALLQKISSQKGDVTVWLGDHVSATGIRAFLLAARNAEDNCLALTELA